jgi:exosortase A-associated hydrolase 2
MDSGGLRLHATVRGPGRGPVAVMADPFAEEKKCAHRVMAEAAEALAEDGLTVLRFDYRGTGDSEGEFEDASLGDWREDLRRAVEWARAELAATAITLVGVRLGATLAAEAAAEVAADALVLVAPIIDGRAYWQENFRRQLIKAKITEGEGASADELRRAAGEERFDLGGWVVTRRMREEIEAVKLPAAEYGGPCVVVDVSARTTATAAMAGLAAGYAKGEVLAIRMEPFWQRIGLIDAAPLVAALRKSVAGGGGRT